MSLGLGIFLSAVFLGIIALFLATRDRWNWRKIVLRPICAVLVLSILGGIGFYVYNRPKPQTSFWGISLDSTEADVKFTKGTSADSDENLWVYNQTYSNSDREATVFVRFQDGKVKGVVFSGSGSYREPPLQGRSLANHPIFQDNRVSWQGYTRFRNTTLFFGSPQTK